MFMRGEEREEKEGGQRLLPKWRGGRLFQGAGSGSQGWLLCFSHTHTHTVTMCMHCRHCMAMPVTVTAQRHVTPPEKAAGRQKGHTPFLMPPAQQAKATHVTCFCQPHITGEAQGQQGQRGQHTHEGSPSSLTQKCSAHTPSPSCFYRAIE